MSTVVLTAATRARRAVLAELQAAALEATLDVGAFYPQPTGILVGLPELKSRGAFSRTFEVPVKVVSGDPLNSELAVDRLYALADDAVNALDTATYFPSSHRSSANAEPLPALELPVTVTVTELED